jgi:ATP-dependent exoDNAse (exonuclease V) beta subunit
MMTVHKAKGLEFPVVILVDPTSPLPSAASRHVDTDRGLWAEPLAGCSPRDLLDHRDLEQRKDEQEELRLAYVAATRARDLLVVPVVGDEQRRESWLSVLNPVVYPPLKSQRHPERAPSCPAFGSESVLDRPPDAEAPPGSSVAPGLHRPRLGTHTVVWWDPAALTLDVEHQLGLRQQRLLDAAERGTSIEEGRAAFERWQAERDEILSSGALPSLRVDSVTATARVFSAREVEVRAVRGDRAGRPAGIRFGTLVHATLAAVDLGASAEVVRSVAAVRGRMLGAPPEEVEAATTAACAALAHPLLRQAAGSSDLRRETPVLLRRADGSLVEGIVDLAFRETAEGRPRWTVVDFKTDEAAQPEHHAQVRLYMEAIAQATGEAARGVLLLV